MIFQGNGGGVKKRFELVIISVNIYLILDFRKWTYHSICAINVLEQFKPPSENKQFNVISHSRSLYINYTFGFSNFVISFNLLCAWQPNSIVIFKTSTVTNIEMLCNSSAMIFPEFTLKYLNDNSLFVFSCTLRNIAFLSCLNNWSIRFLKDWVEWKIN